MARIPYETYTKVYWCTTIANKNAPTVAEITAGVALHGFITKDGINPPNSQNMIDSSTIDENFDAQGVGSWGGGAFTLKMYRDPAADTAYNLVQYGTVGYLVVGRLKNVTPIAGDKVEVWPAQMHEPVMDNTAANEQQKFTASFAITSAPAMRATVA